MEFKVGSLMNLISGKSERGEPSKRSSNDRIVFKHKARAPSIQQPDPADDADKLSMGNLSFKSKNNQSHKSQNFKGKYSTLKSLKNLQGKFKRDTLNKSFKNRGIPQESRPEFVENSSKTVMGKSFKYINYEKTSNTSDTIDGYNSDKLQRTLFVGNLPLTQISDKAIRKLFAPFGEIESFRLRSVPLKDLRLPRKVAAIKADFHPDRTSTNAYVIMKSRAAVEAALALNGTILESHHLRVDLASSPQEGDPRKTIFLGNVSFKAEEDDLWSLFQLCGDIEYVRIVRDRDTSVSKGAAYVNFKSADSVELALRMEGTAELNGRLIKIHRYIPGHKKSLHYVSSRKSGPRNTKDDIVKDDERFRKKMKRREKREAENAKNEAMGVRSRPLKEFSTKDDATNAFVGVKADGVKQKKKKKKFNKGEVQRKKVAKILGSVKSEGRKETDEPKIVNIDEQSGSSVDVTTRASPESTKKSKKQPKGKVAKKIVQRRILLEHEGEIKKKKLKKVKTKHA